MSVCLFSVFPSKFLWFILTAPALGDEKTNSGSPNSTCLFPRFVKKHETWLINRSRWHPFHHSVQLPDQQQQQQQQAVIFKVLLLSGLFVHSLALDCCVAIYQAVSPTTLAAGQVGVCVCLCASVRLPIRVCVRVCMPGHPSFRTSLSLSVCVSLKPQRRAPAAAVTSRPSGLGHSFLSWGWQLPRWWNKWRHLANMNSTVNTFLGTCSFSRWSSWLEDDTVKYFVPIPSPSPPTLSASLSASLPVCLYSVIILSSSPSPITSFGFAY